MQQCIHHAEEETDDGSNSGFHHSNHTFILDTDASEYRNGAVLSQNQNGVEWVIAYGSCILTKLEKNYSVTCRELLALVYKHFRSYLLGKPFLVRTDHAARVVMCIWSTSCRTQESAFTLSCSPPGWCSVWKSNCWSCSNHQAICPSGCLNCWIHLTHGIESSANCLCFGLCGIFGPIPTSRQVNKYILVVSDYFTRWVVICSAKLGSLDCGQGAGWRVDLSIRGPRLYTLWPRQDFWVVPVCWNLSTPWDSQNPDNTLSPPVWRACREI